MNASDMSSGLWLLGPYLVVPVAVARLLFSGLWSEIAKAYGIWIGLLLLLGFLQGGAHGEGYGWMLIIAMFTTVFAIPLIVLALKIKAAVAARLAAP